MDDFEKWRREGLEPYVRERDAEGRRANRGCVWVFIVMLILLAFVVGIVAAVGR